MKALSFYKSTLLLVLGLLVITPGFAQKKNKVRIKANLTQVIDQQTYIEIQGNSRINRKNTQVPNLTYTVYNDTHEDRTELGTTISNESGKAKFVIPNFNTMEPDSTGFYTIHIAFSGNDEFSKAKKSVSFKKAIIHANIVEKDSINYIEAQLLDGFTKEPIADANLAVQVQRLISPLKIGKEFNFTDDSGNIKKVKIDNDIPGIDGILNIEVALKDSDDYGTVKRVVSAPVGTVVEVENTFDERTLWATRDKTPLFMLIFTNLLLLGIAGLFIYLTRNLIKISKS